MLDAIFMRRAAIYTSTPCVAGMSGQAMPRRRRAGLFLARHIAEFSRARHRAACAPTYRA